MGIAADSHFGGQNMQLAVCNEGVSLRDSTVVLKSHFVSNVVDINFPSAINDFFGYGIEFEDGNGPTQYTITGGASGALYYTQFTGSFSRNSTNSYLTLFGAGAGLGGGRNAEYGAPDITSFFEIGSGQSDAYDRNFDITNNSSGSTYYGRYDPYSITNTGASSNNKAWGWIYYTGGTMQFGPVQDGGYDNNGDYPSIAFFRNGTTPSGVGIGQGGLGFMPSNSQPTADTGFQRTSAGVLEVDNFSTAGDYAQLKEGTLNLQTLAMAGTITGTQHGTTGAVSYSYGVAAYQADGTTTPVSTVTVSNGNGTLTGANYIGLSWSAVSGASGYAIYRTASAGTPSTTGYIGATASTSFNDIGLAIGTPSGNVPSTAPVTNHTGSLYINGNMALGGGAPTVASGFGTSPTVGTGSSAASMDITVGSSPSSTGVITLPVAAHYWVCDARDQTTPANILQTASTTSSVTFTDYALTTGLSQNFTASDLILIKCVAH